MARRTSTDASRDSGKPVGDQALTPRQRQILDFIDRFKKDRGYPPTVREIRDAVGLNSTSSVHAQLARLEDSGILRRERSRSRTLDIARLPSRSAGSAHTTRGEGTRRSGSEAPSQHRPARGRTTESDIEVSSRELANEHGTSPATASVESRDLVEVPLVGRVAAGGPSEAYELVEGTVSLSPALFPELAKSRRSSGAVGAGDPSGPPEFFLLTARGDSMVGAGILDGDLLLVRRTADVKSGDIVVASVEGEATVKRIKIAGRKIYLVPENPLMQALDVDPDRLRIHGKVIGVIRGRVD